MARIKIERKSDWKLRVATCDDKKRVIEFMSKTTWKGRDSDALYEWKFEKNPQGEAVLVVGENSSSEMIAAGVFMPWKMCHRNNTILASQWVDLIVDRAYRGQDIPDKVLYTGRDAFRRQCAKICFAFPNSNSVPVHERNEGYFLGNIVRYVKPLRTHYIINQKIKNKHLSLLISWLADILLKLFSKDTYIGTPSGHCFKKIDQCDETFDRFWQGFKEKNPNIIMTDRDSAYLNWKYIKTPNSDRNLFALLHDREVLGFACLEISQSTGYIVDMQANDDASLRELLSSVTRYFRNKAVDSVVIMALEKYIYHFMLNKFGFVRRPGNARFYVYLEGDVDRDEFRDPANWLVTIGDCDIEKL